MPLPKKIDIRSEIHNGKFTQNRDVIVKAIEQYEGKEATEKMYEYYKYYYDKHNKQ